MFKRLYIFPIIFLLLFSCKKWEPLSPYNFYEITEPEQPQAFTPPQPIIDTTDTTSNSPVIIDQGNSQPTEYGLFYQGTLYAKNIDSIEQYGTDNFQGSYAVATGKFEIHTDDQNQIQFITGEGSPIIPDFPLFDIFQFDYLPYTDIGYDKGENIKKIDKFSDLPLQDQNYYYYFGADDQTQIGSINSISSKIYLNGLILDPLDPALLIKGDLEFETKKVTISNIRMGVSPHGNIPYQPLQFNTELQQIIDQYGLESFNGNIYLGGDIELTKFSKNLPIKIIGDLIIKSYGDNPYDFFEKGFAINGKIGANGVVYITSELFEYLPEDYSVEIGRGSTVIDAHTDDFNITIAGEYGKNSNPLDAILGKQFADFFNFSEFGGFLYARFYDFNDYAFYFETYTNFNIPYFGEFSSQKVYLGFFPDSITFKADMSFGFGIQNVLMKGYIDLTTGDFDFLGYTSTNLEIAGISLYGYDLGVEVSSRLKGVRVFGSMDLGYGLANVQVEGLITADEFRLEGDVTSNLQINGIELPTLNMHALISSKEGVILSGYLKLPYGISEVAVEGKLTADEIAFSGMFSTNIEFAGIQLPSASMYLSVSSKTGVHLNGNLTIPYGIGEVKVSGELTSEKLRVEGSFNSHIKFGGFELPAFGMSFYASTLPEEGVGIEGYLKLPSGLGEAFVGGYINSNELKLTGYLKSDIDLGFTSFGGHVNVTVSSITGVDFDGYLYFPFGLGDISINGYLRPSGAFSLSGTAKYRIKFSDDVYAEASISATVTNNSVSFSAKGTAYVYGVEFSVTVEISVNWSNMTMTFTIKTSLGDFSITVDAKGNNIETGEKAVYRLQ